MQIGIDSYSYHRLFGEIRAGEDDPGTRFARGSLDAISEARRLGADVISLETCYMPTPAEIDPAEFLLEAEGLPIVLAWGAPDGLEFGTAAQALTDLLAWINVAPALGCSLMRIVVASPRIERRADRLETTVAALMVACHAAQSHGLRLSLENHADLTAREIAQVVADVHSPALGVCLDTANARRVGDEPAEATALLAPFITMVHLKDVEAHETDRVSGPRSVAYGTGVVPLDDVLKTLIRTQFDGPLCVELAQLGPGPVDERRMVLEGLGWLRTAVTRLQAESGLRR